MRKLILALITALALIAAPAPQTAAKKTSAKTEKSTAKAGPQIDLNSATADELKSLPGIGDAYSAKIIQNRPYSNKSQIVSKAGVPQATYDKIKDQIIAKQPKGGSSAKSKK